LPKAGSNTSVSTIAKSSTISQPDGDLPALAVDQLPFLQGTQQHHGAGGGEAEAEHQTGDQIPAEQLGQPHTEQGSDGYLRHGAGNGDRFTARRSFKEMCRPTPNINRITPISASSGAK
jgi:hypothetical protein